MKYLTENGQKELEKQMKLNNVDAWFERAIAIFSYI